MEFKKLEIKDERSWFKRVLGTPHTKKTLIYIAIGAIAGAGYFYFTQGKHMEDFVIGDFVKSALIGGFFGFFITNSPCARGKC